MTPLEEIEPISRDSIETRVAERLRELIVSGQLPQGTPLVQRDLAQRLGVSQTPVRIGLSELEREGLVEVGETGRALVSRLTREDLEVIYAARLGLEGLAARVGAAALSDEDVKRMRVLMRELDRLAKAQDVDGYRSRCDAVGLQGLRLFSLGSGPAARAHELEAYPLLAELEPVPARDERVRLAPERVVHVRDAQPPELKDVPEAAGGDERGPRTAPLEHGVRGNGGPMDERLDG